MLLYLVMNSLLILYASTSGASPGFRRACALAERSTVANHVCHGLNSSESTNQNSCQQSQWPRQLIESSKVVRSTEAKQPLLRVLARLTGFVYSTICLVVFRSFSKKKPSYATSMRCVSL